MTTKSEIEKAFEAYLRERWGYDADDTFNWEDSEVKNMFHLYLAGARKLLELAEREMEAFHIRDTVRADAFLAVRLNVLKKLVEGDKQQTTGDEPV